ncbi:glutamine amidotransferase [Rhizobacter sp. LjRoot28]|uniref:glutamine amidotransferase n=1 Tax=Rhizobacter sp. LjRoot28 TaxID=3342309 RepID=UPI003ED0E17D
MTDHPLSCLAVRHLAFEDLGGFAPVLVEKGYDITYREAGIDRLDIPDWLAPDLVVVLGGPIGAYETDRYPWLAHEVAGLQARLAAGLATLGVCLGAQLMASALGAKVFPGPAKEIGWAPLTLSPAGHASPLGALEDQAVLHWHGDTFDLPADAECLASTPLTPHQAFAVGSTALGLQFHAEVDSARIEAWLVGHTGELAQAGVSLPALREASALHGAAALRAGQALLARWLDGLPRHRG